MKCVNNSALYQVTKGPTKSSARSGMQDSGESGDSEMEPDSPRREKQYGIKDRPDNPLDPKAAGVEVNRGNKERSNNLSGVSVIVMGEGHHGNPPLYSLLREEREAELDSDLLIESASEESPKREQVVKATLKPSSPPSSPPPVSSPVTPPPKEKEQEVKEEKKEKPSTVPKEEFNPLPQQQENKMITEAKPKVMTCVEQRPLEDGRNKNTMISTEEKTDTKKEELLLLLNNFNKQKGKEKTFAVKKSN